MMNGKKKVSAKRIEANVRYMEKERNMNRIIYGIHRLHFRCHGRKSYNRCVCTLSESIYLTNDSNFKIVNIVHFELFNYQTCM